LRVQSDERLVDLTRDGYEAAFSAIVDRYRGALERYAGRIVGESRAEDAVQQAFANAHRALMRDDRPIALKAWLYRITHNASLNQLRAIRDEVALDDETLGRPATAMAATHDTTSVAELQARLRETLDLIAALPATQRDALLLAELEGRSHEEIALALDIPSATVRHRVMQARTTLRAAVSAVVPYPIAAQLAGAAASSTESARTAAELAAGAGAGAVAMKFTAGLTATGAVLTVLALPSPDTTTLGERERDRQAAARSAAMSGPHTQVAAVPAAPADGSGPRAGIGPPLHPGSPAGDSTLALSGGGTGLVGLGLVAAVPATTGPTGEAPVSIALSATTDGSALAATTQRRRSAETKPTTDVDHARGGGDRVRRKRPGTRPTGAAASSEELGRGAAAAGTDAGKTYEAPAAPAAGKGSRTAPATTRRSARTVRSATASAAHRVIERPAADGPGLVTILRRVTAPRRAKTRDAPPDSPAPGSSAPAGPAPAQHQDAGADQGSASDAHRGDDERSRERR